MANRKQPPKYHATKIKKETPKSQKKDYARQQKKAG